MCYRSWNKSSGYTLIELLVTIAIIGVLSGIAIPAYQGYTESARMSAGRMNMEPLKIALDEYWIKNGTYVAGEWSNDGPKTLETGNLEWKPGSDGEGYVYTVTAAAGDALANSYTIAVSPKGHDDESVTFTQKP
ncbi:MAG: prepilin-type N-terminal cleavage/methylation domain-containing protein [Candidatus Sedimenticola sp. 6PFRAG5]